MVDLNQVKGTKENMNNKHEIIWQQNKEENKEKKKSKSIGFSSLTFPGNTKRVFNHISTQTGYGTVVVPYIH